MPSETFLCPGCKREHRKAQLMARLRESVGPVICPRCGQDVDTARVMRGDFDSGMTQTGWELLIILGLVSGAGIWYFADMAWWQGGLLGFLGAGPVARVWSHVELRREARRAAGVY